MKILLPIILDMDIDDALVLLLALKLFWKPLSKAEWQENDPVDSLKSLSV